MPHSTPNEAPAAPRSAHAIPSVYPDELASAEDRLIDAPVTGRRALAGVPAEAPRIGLALSGGGIRSATFNLGLLQALARAQTLRHVDFLSTVSGGGYIGGFLGAWINREGIDTVEKKLPDNESKPVRFLRENGRYLAPNGAGDVWAAAATLLRSWVGAVWMMAVLIFGFVLLAAAARTGLLALGEQALPNWAQRPVCPDDWFWPSPWWAVVLVAVVVAVLPLIVAYWLLGDVPGKLSRLAAGLIVLAALAAGLVLGRWVFGAPAWCHLPLPGSVSLAGMTGALVAAGVTFLLWLHAFLSVEKPGDVPDVRRALTDSLALVLMVVAALAALGLVDTLAGSWLLLTESSPAQRVVTPHAVAAALLAAVKLAWPWIAKQLEDKARAPVPVAVITGIVAAGLALLLLTLLDYWALRLGAAIGAAAGAGYATLGLLLAAAAMFGWSWLIAEPLDFVNSTSHHALYSARLTRAYLGATNPHRQDDPARQSITAPEDKDQIEFANYAPQAHGGPLHLLNVTVNETVSGKSQIEQNDRHGLGMTLGPAAITAGRSDHALREEAAPPAAPAQSLLARLAAPFRTESAGRLMVRPLRTGDPGRFHLLAPALPADSAAPPAPTTSGARGAALATARFLRLAPPPPPEKTRALETLPLGGWIGVSGAALSTGLGANTSLGLSFLLGLLNLRLGYWWDSGVDPAARGAAATPPGFVRRCGRGFARLLPAQGHLFDEWLARFHGPARRRWYLTDGGHFENTGAYELIRRRVPIIVVSDCGADPDYAFADVGNLVRKARIDFDAEIKFCDEVRLQALLTAGERTTIGPLAALALPPTDDGATPRFNRRHAALAEVFYGRAQRPGSLLLLVKPTVTGDECADLLNYRSAHAAFPQEPTADQFFDEAQWESYRRLGDFIGDRLFPNPGAAARLIALRALSAATGMR